MTHRTMHHSSSVHANETVPFGFWVYLMSDCVLFAALFATFGVLSNATFGGPTASDLFNLPFVLVETLLLLTSSLTMGLALLFGREGKRQHTFALLSVTFVLGVAFLGMELYEFTQLIQEGSGPTRSAFLSAFFALVGTHGLHVALGALWMLVVGAHVWLNGLSAGVVRKLGILSLFWHFLDVIWIFIFTFVYLFGGLAL